MNYKHQQFISNIVKMTTDENRALIECVVKGYIINEGFGDFLKSAKDKVKNGLQTVKDAIVGPTVNPAHPVVHENNPKATHPEKKYDMRNLTPEQEKAKQQLIALDQRTWNHDYMRFQQACDSIKYFLQTYGNREFNQLRDTQDFKKAMKRGNLMDTYIRPNPAKSADAKQMAFRAFMDAIMTDTNKTLVEAIMKIYNLTESSSVVSSLPVFESSNRDYAVQQLKNDMAAVEVFITRHGIYPWQKFIQSGEYRDAYNTSASKNPNIDGKNDASALINPNLRKTISDAYSVAHSDSYN